MIIQEDDELCEDGRKKLMREERDMTKRKVRKADAKVERKRASTCIFQF